MNNIIRTEENSAKKLNQKIFLFFFISGIPALIYEILWQRALFRVFGVNIQSVTIVVAAFMLGLGLGALLGGFLSQSLRVPRLLLVAGMELTVGLLGLASLAVFDTVGKHVYGDSLIEISAAIICLLIVPTALMGATLPILVDHMVEASGNVGNSTGKLYRINTLGAVTGCIVGISFLFPWLGVHGSIDIAAFLNGCAAFIALSAYRQATQVGRPAAWSVRGRPVTPLPMALPYMAAIALAFLSGFISLSYEIFCIHIASFASATSPVAITVILAVFLLGISNGAHTAAQLGVAEDDGHMVRGTLRALASACLAGTLVLPVLAHAGSLGGGALIGLLILFTFFISRALGTVFPVVSHLAVSPFDRVGLRVGLLYTSNILGATTGTVLTGFILTNLTGLNGMAMIFLGLTLVLIAVLVFATQTSLVGLARLGTLVPVGASLLLAGLQPWLARDLFAALLYKAHEHSSPPLAAVIENRAGIIAVNAAGVVFGGGAYDGAFNTDPVHDTNFIVRPYALSLFHPDPQEVLMIGLGSGAWGQVIANNPFVRHFTIVEINQGYGQLIEKNPQVASLLRNPKVSIIIDDGRRWLVNHPDRRFDAIVANATFHYRMNATNLLSRDFERLIAAHLRPGGVYFFNTTESPRVERTACLTFPYGVRFLNHMMVSDDPLALDPDRWKQVLKSYQIDGRPSFDLANRVDREILAVILSIPSEEEDPTIAARDKDMESCQSVLSRTSDLAPITDDNMGTEWRYPLGLGE